MIHASIGKGLLEVDATRAIGMVTKSFDGGDIHAYRLVEHLINAGWTVD
ncbi:MAG: hypothetical protein JKY32_10565 [Rhizobiales bacterium]|nr:hypothetical protein [Hyphomicrobiales bacterium]